jgi:dihydropteroate synthase
MQQLTQYDDLTSEIITFLQSQIKAYDRGWVLIQVKLLIPASEFCKGFEQSLQLLQDLAKFKVLNYSILVGTSWKSFIGKILDQKRSEVNGFGERR